MKYSWKFKEVWYCVGLVLLIGLNIWGYSAYDQYASYMVSIVRHDNRVSAYSDAQIYDSITREYYIDLGWHLLYYVGFLGAEIYYLFLRLKKGIVSPIPTLLFFLAITPGVINTVRYVWKNTATSSETK